MRIVTAQIEWQGYRVKSIPVDYVLPVAPLDNWPHGRKALAMRDLWSKLRDAGTAGVLWLDPDVAADLDDLAAMQAAVDALPGAMHTGWVKLWPASTGRPEWIWSHRAGSFGFPVAHQGEFTTVAYIATGFLWTPAELLELAWPTMLHWRWEQVDVLLSELALAHDIGIYAAPGCNPKHLHF